MINYLKSSFSKIIEVGPYKNCNYKILLVVYTRHESILGQGEVVKRVSVADAWLNNDLIDR